MADDLWADYLNKLNHLVVAVKLTAFWTLEAAKATKETADYTQLTADCVKKYLGLPLPESDDSLLRHPVRSQSGLESRKQ